LSTELSRKPNFVLFEEQIKLFLNTRNGSFHSWTEWTMPSHTSQLVIR